MQLVEHKQSSLFRKIFSESLQLFMLKFSFIIFNLIIKNEAFSIELNASLYYVPDKEIPQRKYKNSL